MNLKNYKEIYSVRLPYPIQDPILIKFYVHVALTKSIIPHLLNEYHKSECAETFSSREKSNFNYSAW